MKYSQLVRGAGEAGESSKSAKWLDFAFECLMDGNDTSGQGEGTYATVHKVNRARAIELELECADRVEVESRARRSL